MAQIDDIIKNAAQAIIDAKGKIVIFSGAGISVESGVPPFRGENGIWNKYDQTLLDIDRYCREPEICWKGIQELFYSSMKNPKPNEAHKIIANWEKQGLVSFVITQNIDGLHQKAGTKKIAEFHGNVQHLVCQQCGNAEELLPVYFEEKIPRCPICHGLLKPDFVFFGEGIPEKAQTSSLNATTDCKVMIIVGSSGEVYPAAGLPPLAKRNNAVIIEINPGTSSYTGKITDYYIPLRASEAFLRLDNIIQKNKKNLCNLT